MDESDELPDFGETPHMLSAHVVTAEKMRIHQYYTTPVSISTLRFCNAPECIGFVECFLGFGALARYNQSKRTEAAS